MKEIKLQTISVLNFKGVRNQEITFNTAGTTTISGRNATGKSTIRDAFLWLMFDKNAAGEKDFGIKTNDTEGNPIPQIPHEVSATLLVNGEELRIRKCLVEKWVKKTGSIEKAFSGNTTEYYINDVPKKASEYNAYISELCDETVFRTITNPAYLPGMKKEQLRAMLFKIAGEPTDADIANGDVELERLLNLVTDKSIEELQKQTSNEKARIKKELADIPARIDELQRSIPQAEDWTMLESDMDNARRDLNNVESQIEDVSKAIKVENEERICISRELSDKKLVYSNRMNELERKPMEEFNRETMKQNELRSKVALLEAKNGNIQSKMVYVKRSTEELKKQINKRQDRLGELRKEWMEINSSEPSFNEDAFVCPTCHRPLEVDDIEAKKAEMTENFNKDKAAKLNANKNAGLSTKEEVEAMLQNIKENDAELDSLNKEIDGNLKQIDGLKANPLYYKVIELNKTEIQDDMLDVLSSEIAELENRMNEPVHRPKTIELKEQRVALQEAIKDMERRMYKKEQIAASTKRIAELDDRQRELSQLIADKEQVESWIERFNRRKVELTENRINSLFAIVRWRMYNKLINGGDEPTCVPLINGVEYRDANSAAKINGGLDIINTVCQYYGVYAPIFVDNSEGVNELLPTNSQMIRLVVTTEPKLTVSYE